MNIRKMIIMLIVGLAIVGFASMSMAFDSGRGLGFDEGFGGFGGMEGFKIEGSDEYRDEETTSETAEEEETVAEAEPEAPPMEEEEYTEEERVVPVAGEGSEEVVPDIY